MGVSTFATLVVNILVAPKYTYGLLNLRFNTRGFRIIVSDAKQLFAGARVMQYSPQSLYRAIQAYTYEWF